MFDKRAYQRSYMVGYRARKAGKLDLGEQHHAHVLAWHALPGMVRLEM